MDISQIITPEDAIKLDNKQQYQFYFELVQHALECLHGGATRLQDAENTVQETEFIEVCAERILYTVKALELRYLHMDDIKMEIDVTESGYPNASALRFLANEISFIKKSPNNGLEGVKPIVDRFVDKLLKKQERVSKEEVAQAAFSLFHTTIEKDKLHNSFVFGGARKSDRKEYSYVAYWINYDMLYNRPFVSIMYFELKEGEHFLSESTEALIAEAVKKTEAVSPVKSVIYDIDKNLTDIRPKLYKRIDFGPICNVFARDDRPLTIALRNGIKSKNLPVDSFAMELLVEKTESIGVVDTENRFSFVKKKQLQNWGEPMKFDYLMAPHQVIQYLYNTQIDTLKALSKQPIDVKAKANKMNEF